jgi:Leucine-rich repeat (LRR) protein
MKHTRMFTSLSTILSSVFILSACTPPTGGDTTRPTVTSVTSTSNSSVNIVFSEAIVGAGTASKFTITPALGVTAASVSSDAKTVTLTTASQTKNTKYTLGVSSSIKDTAGNVVNPIPATALAFTGRGGKLTVTVTGLPAGVNPDVVVTEVDTSSQPVTASSVVLDNVGSGTLSFVVKAVKPDAATFSDDSSLKSLNFVAGVGGSVTLKYACSLVTPPDAGLDAEFKAATGKQTYNCADLAKLTSFTAEDKGIAKIDGIQYAIGLTSLDLCCGNPIGNLPAGAFDNLTQLTSLDLAATNITVLSVGIFDKLTKLSSLNLFTNAISELPAGIFDKLTQLKILFLDLNQISVFPTGIFDKLTQLTNLGLSQNRISVLPAGIFDKLTQLTNLSLSSNKLTSLPPLDKLTKLTDLQLGANCLAAVQEPLKTILSKVNGTVNILSNPKAGCPQKTISITSIKASLLSGSNPTPRTDPETDTIFFKISIDGVAQGDLGIGEKTISQNQTIDINKTLFVNSSLSIEVRKKLPAPEASIGIADLTIDTTYTPGVNKFAMQESDASYVLTLDQK